MASLLHRGMIHPMSIVFKCVEDFKPGDPIYWYEDDLRAEVAHVVNVVRADENYTRMTIALGDFATVQTHFNYNMLRVPPVNPRVVYHD